MGGGRVPVRCRHNGAGEKETNGECCNPTGLRAPGTTVDIEGSHVRRFVAVGPRSLSSPQERPKRWMGQSAYWSRPCSSSSTARTTRGSPRRIELVEARLSTLQFGFSAYAALVELLEPCAERTP